MTAALDRLRAIGIYNPHNAARYAAEHGCLGVYVAHRPGNNGRAFVMPAWQVIRPGFQTDPDGWWGDHGHKTFHGRRADTTIRDKACRWAADRYGITDPWAPIAGLRGCLFPATDATIVLAAAKKGPTP